MCVKKPDGTLCVTIDFRMVNKDMINDAYPMHRVEDQLEAMSGSSVFTTLDLTKGYYQMRLAEESKEITSFLSPKGLFLMKSFTYGDEDVWSCLPKTHGSDAGRSATTLDCRLY